MTKQCTTCGGSMAHYSTVPDTYCFSHKHWLGSGKYASICITAGENPEEANELIRLQTQHEETHGIGATIPTEGITNRKGLIDAYKRHVCPTCVPDTAERLKRLTEDAAADIAVRQLDLYNQKMRSTGSVYICPTDGTLKLAVDSKELIPYKHKNYDSKTNNWKADEKIKERADKELTTPSHLVAVERTREHLEKIKGPALSLIEQMPEHKRFETVKSLADSPLQEMNENLYQPLRESLGLSGGQFEIEGSIQKEAMWYFLKPRWILRRKASAIIRNKVRSVVSPVMSRHTK